MVGRPSASRCEECRRRRVKCDGAEPACTPCRRFSRDCPGYRIRYEFRVEEPRSSRQVTGTPASDQPLERAFETKSSTDRDLEQALPSQGQLQVLNEINDPAHLIPGGRPVYTTAFLDVLEARFFLHNDHKPTSSQSYEDPNASNVFSSWIMVARDLGEQDRLLKDTLLAMSCTQVGSEMQDLRIVNSGFMIYKDVLQGLGRYVILENQQGSQFDRVDAMLLTCMACAKFELLANNSLVNMGTHLGGLGALFRRQGVENIRSLTSRNMYYEYRPHEMAICLSMRRNSFLSSEHWKNAQWILEYPLANAPLHRLLDVAFEIPPFLEELGQSQSRLDQGRPGSYSLNEKLHSILAEFVRIHEQLNTWYDRFANREGNEPLYISRPSTWSNLTIDFEERTKGKIFPVSYFFPKFINGMALVYFDAIRIKLLTFIDDSIKKLNRDGNITPSDPIIETATGLLNSTEAYESASRICKSTEFFFDRGRILVGPLFIMFPFHVAFSVFCQFEMYGNRQSNQKQPTILPWSQNFRRELKWCQMVSSKYEEARLPSLASLELGRSVNKFLELQQLLR